MKRIFGWIVEKTIFLAGMTVILLAWAGAWVLYWGVCVYYWTWKKMPHKGKSVGFHWPIWVKVMVKPQGKVFKGVYYINDDTVYRCSRCGRETPEIG